MWLRCRELHTRPGLACPHRVPALPGTPPGLQGGLCSPGTPRGCQGISGAPRTPPSSLHSLPAGLCLSQPLAALRCCNSISAIPWISPSQLWELLHQPLISCPASVRSCCWGCHGNSRSTHIATVASGTLSQSVPSHCDSRLQDIVTPPTPRDSSGTRSAMAAATAGTGSRSLRARGSSRGSLLARRLQLTSPGFQSVRPDVSPLGSRAPQRPHTPQNVQLLPLIPGPSVPSGRSPPDSPVTDPGRVPGAPTGISRSPGNAEWGVRVPQTFLFCRSLAPADPS